MPKIVIRHKGKIPLNNDGQALDFDLEEFIYGLYPQTNERFLYIYNSSSNSWATSSIAGLTNSQVVGVARSPSGEILVNTLVGTFSYIQTSTNNGVTWTPATFTQSVGAFLWSNNYSKFVGGPRNPPPALSPETVGFTTDIFEVPEWNAIFATSQIDWLQCYKSTNGGQSWSSFTASHPQFGSSTAVKGQSIAFNGSRIIISGLSTAGVFYSDDGTNFYCTQNNVISPARATWHPFTNKFYGVIESDPYVYSSITGLDFAVSSPNLGTTLWDIATPGTLMAIHPDKYWISNDGTNWSVTYSIPSYLYSVGLGKVLQAYTK